MRKLIIILTVLLFIPAIFISCGKKDGGETTEPPETAGLPGEQLNFGLNGGGQIEKINISSPDEWEYFTGSYDNDSEKYSEYVFVNIILPFDNNSLKSSLGTAEKPFNGEIDFNNRPVMFDCIGYITDEYGYIYQVVQGLINVAQDVKIINYAGGDGNRTLVKKCYGEAVFENIRIDSGEYYSSILLGCGNIVEIRNTILSWVKIYGNTIGNEYGIGGLIRECKVLNIINLNMSNVSVSIYTDTLASYAALVVQNADEINIEDSYFHENMVISKGISSGLALYCEKINSANVTYHGCVMLSYGTLSTMSAAVGLTAYGLTHYGNENVVFNGMVLKAVYFDELFTDLIGLGIDSPFFPKPYPCPVCGRNYEE